MYFKIIFIYYYIIYILIKFFIILSNFFIFIYIHLLLKNKIKINYDKRKVEFYFLS